MGSKWWTLSTVCTATFMLLLDITIVNVALPAIERALHASFSDLQWVVDAYALALATCVLTAGSLADLFGRKRVFVIGVVALHARLGGLRRRERPALPDHRARRPGDRRRDDVRDRARAALAGVPRQGARHGVRRSGARRSARRSRSARSPAGCSPRGSRGAGSSSSTSRSASSRSSSSAKQLHESSDPEHSRLDPIGLVTLTGGLFCLILALIEGNKHGWTSSVDHRRCSSPPSSCSALFIVSQPVDRTTMVDLTLFRRPAFVGAQTTAFAISSSMFAMFLYLTLYLQNILGLSPLQTGLRFLPLASSRSSPRRSPAGSRRACRSASCSASGSR